MDADEKLKGVAEDLGQADFAAVRVSLGAPVKTIWKLYLGTYYGADYTPTSLLCGSQPFEILRCAIRPKSRRIWYNVSNVIIGHGEFTPTKIKSWVAMHMVGASKKSIDTVGIRNADAMFSLDSADRRSLSEQLAQNIASAVASGALLPGDRLPSLKKMAALCGTSIRVPIDAVVKLGARGIVKGRPRHGIEILSKGRKVYCGNVVLIRQGEHTAYYREALYHAVSMNLNIAGWSTEYVTVPSSARSDARRFLHLQDALARNPAFALGVYCSDDVLEKVSESGVPFAVLTSMNKTVPKSVGRVSFCTARALVDLALECRKKGISRVLLVKTKEDNFRFADIFASQGIETELLQIGPDVPTKSGEIVGSLASASASAIFARLSKPGSLRPDLIYLADDGFAEGCLWQLTVMGLKVPEDIRVVTFANKGNVPYFIKPLARIEEDLVSDAHMLSRAIIRFLKTRVFKMVVLSSSRFVSGSTF